MRAPFHISPITVKPHVDYVVWVGPLVVKELKRIVEASEITKCVPPYSMPSHSPTILFNREDDTNWPKKNIVGKQELEIRVGNDHIAFEVSLSRLRRPSLTYLVEDGQNRLPCRHTRQRGPRRIASILLPGPGSQGMYSRCSTFALPSCLTFAMLVSSVLDFLLDLTPFQDKAHINASVARYVYLSPSILIIR